MIMALDPVTMSPMSGDGSALTLRAGFEGVLPTEEGVRSLHIVPQSRLLLATCAGSPATQAAGASAYFSFQLHLCTKTQLIRKA